MKQWFLDDLFWIPFVILFCILYILIYYWLKKRILKGESKKTQQQTSGVYSILIILITYGILYDKDFVIAYSLASLMVLIQQTSTDKNNKELNLEIGEMKKQLNAILTEVKPLEKKPIIKDTINSPIPDEELRVNIHSSFENKGKKNIFLVLLLVFLITLIGKESRKNNK